MVGKRFNVVFWLGLISFFFVFGMITEAQSKDFIQWKGKVIGIAPTQQQCDPSNPSTCAPTQAGIPSANISIASNPSISTISDNSGNFVLAGIPANTLHYFKVSKTGYVTTNIGFNMGNTDLDTSMCDSVGTPTGGGGTPPIGTCMFNQKLFAVSDAMKVQIFGDATHVGQFTGELDTTKGLLQVTINSMDFTPINIDTVQVRVTVNGNGPLPPNSFVQMGPNMLLIPNIPPGDTSVSIEGVGTSTIPALSAPVFAGELTIAVVNALPSNMGTITGKVTQEDGTAIANAKVNAMPDGFGMSASAITDSLGNYTLKLSSGSYRISAFADNYAQQFYYMTDRWDLATLTYVDVSATVTGVDFKLSSAKKISGTVMAGTAPVVNAQVNAWSMTTQTGGGAQTDANGSYTIMVKPASDYKVSARSGTMAEQYYNNKKGMMDADPVDVTMNDATAINFNLQAGKVISGMVRDPNNNPLPYAMVNAWSDSTGSGGSANTDQTGNYSMTVSPAPDYKVSVSYCDSTLMPPKCYPQTFYGGLNGSVNSWDQAFLVDTTDSIDDANIDITLSSGKTISGTVKSGGTGIANINVNAFSPFGFGSAQTDSSGNFTVSVPPGDGYRIEAFSDTYPRVMWKGTISNGEGINDATTTRWDEAGVISTVGGNITGIDITMSQGISISGTVKDNQGSPIQAVWVNANSDSAMGWGGGQTNGKGEFSFTVPPGSGYRISANSPEFPNTFYKTTNPSSCGTDSGCSPDDVDPTWSGATVFNFTDAPVDYTSPMMGPGTTSSTITLPALPNGAKGVDIVFKSSGGTIEGIVKAGNKAVPGVWINGWSDTCNYGVGEATKADGTYVLKVLAGGCSYKVQAFTDAYVQQYYNNKSDWMNADLVAVTDSSPNVRNINFNLSSGTSISGNVKFPDNTNAPNIWVNANSETSMFGGGAQTDACGNYTIKLKPASDYKVGVWVPEYVPQMYNNKTDWMQADLVDISTASATGIDFKLSTGNQISGTVKADNSAPAADAYGNRGWVNAFSDSSGAGAGAPIDASGVYHIKVQPASDYRVQAWVPGYANMFYNNTSRWDAATLVDATTGSVNNIDFNLSSGRKITGQIKDSGGAGKNGVWVNAFSDVTGSGIGEPTKTICDSNGQNCVDGKYQITGLMSGEGYRVSIYSPDFANVFYKDGSPNGTPSWEDATLVDLTNADAPNIDITLGTGGTITGKVKVASGTLTGNVFVDAFSESLKMGRGGPVSYTANATEVTYTLKGLPAAVDYKVHVHADNFGDKFYVAGDVNGTSDWMQATKVTVSGDTQTLGDITLSTGASISGTVYNATKSASNVVRTGRVQAMNPDQGEFQGADIGSDGKYSIKGLVDGHKYTVQAMPFGYIPMFYDASANNSSTPNWAAPNVTATSQGTTGIDIVVSQGHTISGRVLDASDNAVQYAFIGVFNVKDNGSGQEVTPDDMSDNDFLWSPMSDSAGNYLTPPLPAGNYLISATKMDTNGNLVGKGLWRKDKSKKGAAGNIEAALSTSDLTGYDISFKIGSDEAQPGSIAGTITNNSGVDRDEIQVILYNSAGKVAASFSKSNVKNGNSATYKFNKLPPGDYKVKTLGLSAGSGNSVPTMPSLKWYNGADTRADATAVTVGNGADVTGIDITLLVP